MAHGHTVDDYLEAIYFLAFPVGEYGPVARAKPTVAARVAELLGVSRASAGEMVKRLEADGLIERGPHKELEFTATGRAAAERTIRRHRLIERLLTDFMGYTPAESHDQAEILSDTFTDEMIERIADRLGHPERCPHGWPIDPALEQRESRELVAIAELAADEEGTIVRVAEHDGALLHWCYDHGLEPGVTVEIESVDTDSDQIVVLVANQERALNAKTAEGLFVRRTAKALG